MSPISKILLKKNDSRILQHNLCVACGFNNVSSIQGFVAYTNAPTRGSNPRQGALIAAIRALNIVYNIIHQQIPS